MQWAPVRGSDVRYSEQLCLLNRLSNISDRSRPPGALAGWLPARPRQGWHDAGIIRAVLWHGAGMLPYAGYFKRKETVVSIAPGGPRHRAGSVFMETSDVVQELCDVLTSKLVASLAGVKDPGQVRKWARGELRPGQPAEQRLRFAHDVIIQEVQSTQGRRVAQAWAMSINPRLGYESPIKAIRDDRFQETAAAAKALLEDAYDG